MRRGRKLLLLTAVPIVAAALALTVYFRAAQPPAAAQLLPEGDFLLYTNFKPLHLIELSKSGPVQLEGDYQSFVSRREIGRASCRERV